MFRAVARSLSSSSSLMGVNSCPTSSASRKYFSSPGGKAAVTGLESVQRNARDASSGKDAGSYQHLGKGDSLRPISRGKVVLAIALSAKIPSFFCLAVSSTCGPKLAFENKMKLMGKRIVSKP